MDNTYDQIYDIIEFDEISFNLKVLKTNSKILKCKISNVDCEFRFKEKITNLIKLNFIQI